MRLTLSALGLLLFGCGSTVGPAPADASSDAPGADAPPRDAPAADAPRADALTCPLSVVESTACARDEDCAQVRRGCYCDRQPITGVSAGYLAAAQHCELEAARTCHLGCAVRPGLVADDGNDVDDGGTIASRCERADGGAGRCRTYVR